MPTPASPTPEADAIVVLGCPPSARLHRRVGRGIALFAAGAAPRLLLSGGGRAAVPEAELMRRIASANGVPEEALMLEPRSRDTGENARECARLLRAHQLHSVVLVSDRAHLPRAALLFRLEGVLVAARAAVPAASWPSALAAAAYEAVALPRSLMRCLLRKSGLA